MNWKNLKRILQLIATILTTIAGTVCLQSCMS